MTRLSRKLKGYFSKNEEEILKLPLINNNSRSYSKDDRACLMYSSNEIDHKSSRAFHNSTERQRNFSYWSLFQYSANGERILLFISILLALVAALGLPFQVVIYGEFVTLLVDRTTMAERNSTNFISFLSFFGGGRIVNATKEENRKALLEDSKAYFGLNITGALLQFLVLAIAIDLANNIALDQVSKMRKLFFKSVLRQDMSWYDTPEGNNFVSKLTNDLEKIKDGIGEKLITFIYLVSTFIFSVIVSLFYGWKLSLVVMSCTPIVILSTSLTAKFQASLTEKELDSYSEAGRVAEEVFHSIKTVAAFNGENKEIQRYTEKLIKAEKCGKMKGFFNGIGIGGVWFIIYFTYGLALWYGVQLILDEKTSPIKNYTPATLIIILVGILMGAQNMGYTIPYTQSFTEAISAGKITFGIINRIPIIDSMEEEGLHDLEIVQGNIRFENVYFSYPTRNEIPVLKSFNLEIKSGQCVALVGPSGCGKSTCVQLLQRFYDPINGFVKIDGLPLPEFNVGWWRSRIGVVSQEPVLFSTTIFNNILYGNPFAKRKDVEQAASIADCHRFIMKLPDGYQTQLGERGTQLSGGQKQRIAIARAILRNPLILLLDEATSALDGKSERKVQAALEKARQGKTTIIISHRLSTIQNADKIAVMMDGSIAEQGTHHELMNLKGLYHHLVLSTKFEEKQKQPLHIRTEITENTDMSTSAVKNESQKVIKKDLPNSNAFSKQKGLSFHVNWLNLLQLNLPEWRLILIGCVAACAYGGSLPAFSVIFGEFFGILSLSNPDEIAERSKLYFLYFVLLGIVAFVGSLIQNYVLNLSGVRLTTRLRKLVFKSIITKDISWFDKKENSVGVLSAKLSTDCAKLEGASGNRLGIVTQAIAMLIVGFLISLTYSWNLTMATLVMVPFLLGSMLLEAKYMNSSSIKEKESIAKASQVAIESISNIKTIASLCREPFIIREYNAEIDVATNASRTKIRYRGCLYSLGQSSSNFAYAAALYYGGMLVSNGEIPYKDVIKVTEALIFGAMILGQVIAYSPGIGEAFSSANRIKEFLIQEECSNYNEDISDSLLLQDFDETIAYKHVDFRYPSRPDIPVLQDFNLKISKGFRVGFIGSSGCGKSTCVQLLLRLYDPTEGRVLFGLLPTTEISRKFIRSKIGFVSQEPNLFEMSIAENIAYGDNSRKVPMSEIIDAAIMANIHDFIVNLKMGYETLLGNQGTQLSGGQKQRIAIARAFIKNPDILVLDEATSALDVQNEKCIQSVLKATSEGRTCITIAHRVSTISNSDLICVVKEGKIIEIGSHTELMTINGVYAEMYNIQLTK